MIERSILIFPKLTNIDIINEIRRKYDPLSDLVMPHITLVFPFISSLDSNMVEKEVEKVTDCIRPFSITLQGIKKHISPDGYYLFLELIEGIESIQTLHDALYEDFFSPFYRKEFEYIPHLTIGKFSSKEAMNQAYQELKCYDKFLFQSIINTVTIEKIGNSGKSMIEKSIFIK